MAKEEHVRIVRSGAVAIDEWRKVNPGVQLELDASDFTGADLAGAHLENALLAGADLVGTRLAGAFLEGANLYRATLKNADLEGAHMKGAFLEGANLEKANLARAELTKADFAEANLAGTNLSQADLSEACILGSSFFEANLEEANLRRATGSEASFYKANLRRTILAGATLSEADFASADLGHADLEGANLESANLEGANLTHVNLKGGSLAHSKLERASLTFANLEGANLRATNLEDADLEHAILKGANLEHAILLRANLHDADLAEAQIGKTVFGDLDLRRTRGLVSVSHHAPSILGMETVFNSSGTIDAEFLRGCGLDPLVQGMLVGVEEDKAEASRAWLAQGKSIRARPSYVGFSFKDKSFAHRLRAALSRSDLSYWYASTDISDLERAVRDGAADEQARGTRLVLLCSKNALQGDGWPKVDDWLEWQTKQAFETEDATGIRIIFTVVLDDALSNWDHPVADRLRKSVVADFHGATEGSRFDEVCAKVLIALQDTSLT